MLPERDVPPSGRAHWIAWGALAALLLAGAVHWREALWALLTDQARLQAWIEGFGPWAPLAAILFVIIKVLAAPIPGQIVGTVNGYLFGTAWGTLYSMIGVTMGTWIAMSIGRYGGRPAVARLIGAATLAKWDDLAQRRGLVFFLLVYLLPFTPDDLISFVVGLSPLALGRALAWATLARLPGMIVGNWFGAAASRFTPWQWALVGLYVVGWIGLTIRHYAQLEAATLRLISGLEGRWSRMSHGNFGE